MILTMNDVYLVGSLFAVGLFTMAWMAWEMAKMRQFMQEEVDYWESECRGKDTEISELKEEVADLEKSLETKEAA